MDKSPPAWTEIWKKYRSTIKSAFYNSKYIGVVLSEENDKTGEMEVYDLSGKRKLN